MDIDGKSKVLLKTHSGSLTCKNASTTVLCSRHGQTHSLSFLLMSKRSQSRVLSNPLLSTFEFASYIYCKLVSKDRNMMGKCFLDFL